MRAVVDPGPTCDDGVDHIWVDASSDARSFYREPVVKTCTRCGRAVGPQGIENIQRSLGARQAQASDRRAALQAATTIAQLRQALLDYD